MHRIQKLIIYGRNMFYVGARCLFGRLNLLISINNFENKWEKLVDAKVSHKLLESAKLLISLDIRLDG